MASSNGDSWGQDAGDSWGQGNGDSWGQSGGGSRAHDKGSSKGRDKGDSWNQDKGDSWGHNDGDSWDQAKGGSSNRDKGDSWGQSDGDSWGQAKGGSNNQDKGDSWGRNGGDSGRERGPRREASDGQNGEERPEPYKPREVDLEEEAKLQEEAGENFKRYQEQSVTCFPKDAIQPITNFNEVIESQLLLKNVTELNYKEMTPIQKWAMPAIQAGHDIIGCAQTGSGKTAAFLLPILQSILKMDLQTHDPNSDCQNPYCLIISPTRELARQIYTHTRLLSKDSIVKSCCIYGQIATFHLKAQLQNGCHILVATLGRLKDFLERGWIGFSNIKYIVMDEGDRLIDEGFRGDISAILQHESMTKKEERQTLFFSATFKKDVQAIAREHLRESFLFLAVGKIGSSNEDIKQEFLQIERSKKKTKLISILRELPESDKAIIFTQTKSTADFLAGFFTSSNLPSASIHGDRHQHQREQALSLFKKGERRFLISSPVGNRGLDLPKVAVVINYEMPTCIDEYVHRIGRTGRAGHTGRAISFIDLDRDREILPDLIKNLKDAKQEIPEWLTEDGSASGFGGGSGDADFNNQSFKMSFNNAGEDWNANTSSAAVDEDWGGSANTGVATSAAPAASVEEDWGTPAVDSNPTREAPNDVKPNVANALNDDDWGTPSEATGSRKRPADDDEGENPPKRLDAGVPLPTSTDDAW